MINGRLFIGFNYWNPYGKFVSWIYVAMIEIGTMIRGYWTELKYRIIITQKKSELFEKWEDYYIYQL